MILLRTLTEKSVFHEGKYAGQTIGSILKVDWRYLVWIYFKYEKISFDAGILKLIGIDDNWKIHKPGANLNKHHDFCSYIISKMNPEERHEYFKAKKAQSRKRIREANRKHQNDDKLILSKSSLKRMNAGNTHLNLSLGNYNQFIK